MNSITKLFGIILIVVGIIGLGYSGITYTSQERVADIGPVKINADTQKTIHLPPIVSGLCLVAGIFLVMSGRKR